MPTTDDAPTFVVTLNGTVVDADVITLRASMGTERTSPFMGSAGQIGNTVDLDLSSHELMAAAGIPHPWTGTFGPFPARPVTIDIIFYDDEGEPRTFLDPDGAPVGAWRVFTGTTRQARASLREGSVTVTCSDLDPRLYADVVISPLARRMPPRAEGDGLRAIGLHTAHHTARALEAAGMPPHQPRLPGCVMFAQHAGSSAPLVGRVMTSWHDDYGHGVDPAFHFTADGSPYVAYPHIRYRSEHVAVANEGWPWLLSVDLPPDTASDTDILVVASSSFAPGGEVTEAVPNNGFGVRILATEVRLVSFASQVETVHATWVRPVHMRRLVVTYSNTGLSNLRWWSDLAPGVEAYSINPNLMLRTYTDVHVKGWAAGVGAVQVARAADVAPLVTQVRTVKPRSHIHRVVPIDGARDIDASPYITTSAIELLTEQAAAQGTALWVDEYGHVRAADQESLPALADFHLISDDPTAQIDLLNIETTLSGGDVIPHSHVQVEFTKFAVEVRNLPSVLIASGNRETLQSGDVVTEFFHPAAGEHWLDVDTEPVLWHGTDTPEAHRRIGSVIGGYRVHQDTGAIFGLTPEMFSATITQVDPRTVLYEATVGSLGTLMEMVTLPNPNDPVTELRGMGSDPLPAIRSMGRVTEATERTTPVPTASPPGGGIFVHKASFWVQRPGDLAALASRWVAAINNPPSLLTVTTSLGPVKLGDTVTARSYVTPGLEITGRVIDRDITGPNEMVLSVRPTVPVVAGRTYGAFAVEHAIAGDTTYGAVQENYDQYIALPTEV